MLTETETVAGEENFRYEIPASLPARILNLLCIMAVVTLDSISFEILLLEQMTEE